MKPILFLDVDGVLNNHSRPPGSDYCTICPENVRAFNVILKAGPAIVLSSAWRYMIHGKQMSLLGFEYMLHTHGVIGIAHQIIGVTCRDEDCCHCLYAHKKRDRRKFDTNGFVCCKCEKPSTRGQQIARWLKENRVNERRYVVLDDEDYGISDEGHPFVQTNGKKGLTVAKAREVARMLREVAG